VVGLWSAYHVIDWPPDTQYLGVSFQPAGAYPFLKIPLSELHHQVVPLDAIWGQRAAEIRERLAAASTPEERFDVFEQFLLARLYEANPETSLVEYAVAEIARQRGALSIRALSEQMGISQKHLIAQFNRVVGGTPKALARLYRFSHLVYSIDPTQPVDWTVLAHQSLYYDQSHFNHEFEAFSGHSPGDYLRLRRHVQAENPAHAQHTRLLPAG
jgi:AraC-like DNA-binding protein